MYTHAIMCIGMYTVGYKEGKGRLPPLPSCLFNFIFIIIFEAEQKGNLIFKNLPPFSFCYCM